MGEMKTLDEILAEITMPGQFGSTFNAERLVAFLRDQQRQIEDLKFMVRMLAKEHGGASELQPPWPVSFKLQVDGVLRTVVELGPELEGEMLTRWKSLTNRAESA